MAVMAHVDSHGGTKVSGAAAKTPMFLNISPGDHFLHSGNGKKRPDKDGVARAYNDVGAVMYAITAIYIQVTGLREHGLVTLSAPAPGVRGTIVTGVGLCFDNQPRRQGLNATVITRAGKLCNTCLEQYTSEKKLSTVNCR